MTVKKSVSVFGVTGSIGASTVDVLKSHTDKYVVEAVTAHRNVDALAKVAIDLGAKCAVIGDPNCFDALKSALAGTEIDAGAGEDALIEAAERPSDIVIAAIVGAAGLKPTLAAIRRGARIGLANKDTLVCAGALMTAEIAKHGATLIPVDSEHSAIFQVLEDHQETRIDRILLTASGGPFREWSLNDMRPVTRAQALAHPNWEMGAKISIDSATMMNKGLERLKPGIFSRWQRNRLKLLFIPSLSFTAWWNIAMGLFWPSLVRPTCAPRSPMRFHGLIGSRSIHRVLILPRSAA